MTHIIPTARPETGSTDRIPVEIQEDAAYYVIIDVPEGLTFPERRAYHGEGVEGVRHAMAQIIRDGARMGRYDMHMGVNDFVVNRLQELKKQLGELRQSAESDPGLTADLEKRIESLSFILRIGKIVHDIAGAVDAGTFNANAEVPDAVVQEGDALPEDSPKTYGAFVEEFLYEMSKGSLGRYFDWSVPFTVVEAS